MGRVIVHGVDMADDRLERLRVQLGTLPERVIDRDTAIAWMKDGHSFLPKTGQGLGRRWQLVEAGEPTELYVRDDHEATPADAVGGLPGTGA